MNKSLGFILFGNLIASVGIALVGQAGHVQAAETLPVWQYSVTSPIDGNPYVAQIVGRSPLFHGHTSTTVKAYLVPIVFTFSDGSVFDPTVADACSTDTAVHLVQQSPLFQSAPFAFTDASGNNPVNVGATQYEDAFERASFWNYVAPQTSLVLPIHTLLAATTLPALHVTVPAADGSSHAPALFNGCAFGAIDYGWFTTYLTNTLIPAVQAQGVGPTNVPIFLFRNVVMYPTGGSSSCPPSCYLGEHGNITASSQTYVVADFDTTGSFDPDIAALSRELGGWMNDPYSANTTPGWSSGYPEFEPGQTPCQTLLEVGDPLSGSEFPVTMSNSFTYDPQELVFPSWFYRQSPSIAIAGRYSDNGSFTSDAGAACQASAQTNAAVHVNGN